MSLHSHSAHASNGRGMSPSSPARRQTRCVSSPKHYRSMLSGSALLALLAQAIVASPANAQDCSVPTELVSVSSWNAPLDRPVSLHARGISLRDALDRVSADARVKLSYTTESIPADSTVCAAFDALPLGEALGILLRGTLVLPVAADADRVALVRSKL